MTLNSAQLDFSSLQPPSPSKFGLDFPAWRTHQYETVQWALEGVTEGVINITENPTGSGKSMIAMSLLGNPPNLSNQVIALTESRNLQRQYDNLFEDCWAHFGRGNYACIHPKNRLPNPTANDCIFDSDMKRCPYYTNCPYIVSRNTAINSNRVALNYAYWLTARHLFKPNWLVLDEAHNLSDIVLNHVGVTIGERLVKRYNLPDLPTLRGSDWSLFTNEAKPHAVVLDWLDRALWNMRKEEGIQAAQVQSARLGNHAGSTHNVALNVQYMQLVREIQNLENTQTSLSANPGEHWYIRSTDDSGYYHGHSEPALICRPLTARYDFKRYFMTAPRTLVMSATIGDMDTFATELGIKEYKTRVVPNQWPPQARPVHILDVPSMGRKSAERDSAIWNKQAQEIAKAILSCPPDWSGFVHVTRKSEAVLLAKRLGRLGLEDRVFVTPGHDGSYAPTEQQWQAWENFRNRVPGAICVSWAFFQGVDGTSERISIVAKVPWGFLGDPYEIARRDYSGAMFIQRAAWTLEQGLGRTRRGNVGDYDTPDETNGYVAIADSDWSRTKKYLSQSLREAIVEG